MRLLGTYISPAESGFYYLQSRYYDPEIGRFINADGYVSAGQDITSYNMFVYCGNNPINRADSTGMFWKEVGDFFSSIWCGIKNFIADFSETNVTPNKTSSTSSPDTLLEEFKNQDGSYSLYDNHRHNSNGIFHEQILSTTISPPAFSLVDNTATLGAASITVMTGGWEMKYLDLSLLDIGKAELAAGYQDGSIGVTAMASAWAPSATIVLWDVNITVSAHVGSIGGDFNVGSGKFAIGAAYGWGASVSFEW